MAAAFKHAIDYEAVLMDTLFGAAGNTVLAGLKHEMPKWAALVVAAGLAHPAFSPTVNGFVAFQVTLPIASDWVSDGLREQGAEDGGFY